MAKIKLVLCDDEGKPIAGAKAKDYAIAVGNETLDEIEAAVEDFKLKALPELEYELLSVAQERLSQQVKKKLGVKNGKTVVTIKTLHGQFVFPIQRYKYLGEEQTFWKLKGNRVEEYAGIKLQELYAYYSNRLSYSEVESLIERITGEKQLSDQGIWAEVKSKVAEISQEIVEQVKPILEQIPDQKLSVNPQIDLYNPQQEEILLFEDGILVKGQKAERESRTQLHKSRKQPSAEDPSQKFYQTDVVLLQKAQGGYEYMTTPIDAQGKVILSLEEVLRAKVVQEYGLGTSEQPLNLVAIADGAKSIRCRMKSVFGEQVTMILDWYHLSRKVRKLMGSVARNQAEKSEHLKFLLSNLWQGKVAIAIEYLQKQVKTKKPKILEELINYLSKHQSEIINYQRRQKAGKPIGSGRVEKAVDLVVGHRQKKKGMSWSAKGSQALAVLRVAELNRQWGAIFGMETSVL